MNIDTKKLAAQLTERPREIPDSEECKKRLKVKIRVRDGDTVEDRIVDALRVGSEVLLLVWRWEQREGEEVPVLWSTPLRLSEHRLIESSSGEFSIAWTVPLPGEESTK